MADELPKKKGRKPGNGSRHHYTLPSCSDKEIAYIKERCLTGSEAEVVRNALHVYAGLLKRVDAGYEAILRHKEDKTLWVLHDLALTAPHVPPEFMGV